MQHDTADELDPEGPHAQHAPARLPRDRKGLGQQIVQTFAVLVALLEFPGLGLERLVAERGGLVGQGFDLIRDRLDALELPVGITAE